jgi:NADH dehydrogenase
VPVVVTGANGGVGRTLVPVLVPKGEVRAVVRSRSGAALLEGLGAKVAVVDLEDVATLAVVMDSAHTVIHLAGGLDLPDDAAYEAANLGTVRDALEAAVDAEVARFILLSYPGAAPDSGNAYLRAKGQAEDAVRASGLEAVILRATHVHGPGQRWTEEMRRAATQPIAAAVIGPGTQRLAPVHVRDVAAALAAADDRSGSLQGTLALGGPDVVTVDEVVDRLAGRRRRKVHLAPRAAARVARLRGRRLHPALLEVLAADSLPDGREAAPELGVRLTPFVQSVA